MTTLISGSLLDLLLAALRYGGPHLEVSRATAPPTAQQRPEEILQRDMLRR